MTVSTKSTFIACALALCASAGAALAREVSDEPPAAQGTALSRAEVLADLQIWRESGLADVNEGTLIRDEHKAQVRYAALRASPRYADLVRRFSAPRESDMSNFAAKAN